MILVAVISANRPNQVAEMEAALAGLKPNWYVPIAQVNDYLDAGAKQVIGVEGIMPMKSKQLNKALDDGFKENKIVVTLDDDYNNIKKTIEVEGKLKTQPYSLRQAIQDLVDSLEDSDFYLAGVGASLNALFSGVGIKYRGKVNGQLMAQKPNIVRYDENLKSQVDFEYCLAHHAQHNGVIIHKSLLVDFHMFGRSENKDRNYQGGLSGYRTIETNLESAKVMSERYGIYVEAEQVGGSRKSRIQYKNIKWIGKPSWSI